MPGAKAVPRIEQPPSCLSGRDMSKIIENISRATVPPGLDRLWLRLQAPKSRQVHPPCHLRQALSLAHLVIVGPDGEDVMAIVQQLLVDGL